MQNKLISLIYAWKKTQKTENHVTFCTFDSIALFMIVTFCTCTCTSVMVGKGRTFCTCTLISVMTLNGYKVRVLFSETLIV